jgi:membrane protein YdbS with pleckstrin-like domain
LSQCDWHTAAVAYPKALLSAGEDVVLDLHPHAKALIVPLGLVPVVLGVGSFVAAEIPDGSAQKWVRLAILVIGLLILAWFSLWPFLKWRTTHYVVTTRRIVHRSGVLSRSGRDVPLNRVNDVSFSHGPLERLLRCGTLVVESAGDRGQVVLADVPHVERVQHTVYDLVQHEEDRLRQEEGTERDATNR